MPKAGIEWTEDTWNPIVGCSIVSPGCTNCYAMKMAARLEAMGTLPHYAGMTKASKGGAVWTGKLALAPERTLLEPLRRRKPTTYFVNSMGDLFHEDVPDEWIDRVFAVMALAPQHTFQVLTKRAARMRAYLASRAPVRFERSPIAAAMLALRADAWRSVSLVDRWPLPNVWLGVSTEDQRRADERIPDLLATPAAVRFVSAEPLLGPIDFQRWLERCHAGRDGDCFAPSSPQVRDVEPETSGRFCPLGDLWHLDEDEDIPPLLDWIIVGGESGPGARPMHPDWARQIRDQCAAAGTAFFFKQWGAWAPALDRDRDDPDWRADYSYRFADRGKHCWINLAGGGGFHGDRFHVMRRGGKAGTGRLLDGVQHDACPEARS